MDPSQARTWSSSTGVGPPGAVSQAPSTIASAAAPQSARERWGTKVTPRAIDQPSLAASAGGGSPLDARSTQPPADMATPQRRQRQQRQTRPAGPALGPAVLAGGRRGRFKSEQQDQQDHQQEQHDRRPTDVDADAALELLQAGRLLFALGVRLDLARWRRRPPSGSAPPARWGRPGAGRVAADWPAAPRPRKPARTRKWSPP